MYRFRKGIALPDFKYRSLSEIKIDLPRPSRFVRILLDQQTGGNVQPCVTAGDSVLVGTQIAQGTEWSSVPLHSSASGRVAEVSKDSILIESDEADRLDPAIQIRGEIPTDPRDVIRMIREAGIVDLGGSAFPTHVRLIQMLETGVKTLVINGCESEPFLTADHVLMLHHPVEILKGSELLRLACGAERTVIAVEKNKLEAVEILNSKNYNLKIKHLEIVSLPVRYPQDSERALASAVIGRPLKKTEAVLSAGVLVEHVATAFAVYEAVYLNKPLYERAVTIGGPCVVEPKNVWARVGTSAADLIRSAKGLMREPERIIFGGPMTGKTIEHLEIPVTKAVRGVLALPPQLTVSGDPEPCIRCGWCADVCPESLNAEAIVRAVQNEDESLAQEFGIEACVDCGCCTYVCPSKIPMGFFIQKGKRLAMVPGTTVPGSENPAPAVPGTVMV